MREEPKHGGPAFPVQPFSTSCYDWSDGSEGMTLRDWFAGSVVSGMYASCRPGYTYETPEAAAEYAYKLADAMLAARKGGQP